MSCNEAHYLPIEGTISMSGELYRLMIQKVQQDEQERIIKLLDSNQVFSVIANAYVEPEPSPSRDTVAFIQSNLIALIKGENK